MFLQFAQNPVFGVGRFVGGMSGGGFFFGRGVDQLFGIFALRIVGTTDKGAELAEFDAQTTVFAVGTTARIAAVLAFGEQMLGQHFVNFVNHFAHLQRGNRVNVFNELGPKSGKQLAPFHFTGGNIIEKFFHLSGKIILDVFLEEVFQKGGYDAPAFFRG